MRISPSEYEKLKEGGELELVVENRPGEGRISRGVARVGNDVESILESTKLEKLGEDDIIVFLIDNPSYHELLEDCGGVIMKKPEKNYVILMTESYGGEVIIPMCKINDIPWVAVGDRGIKDLKNYTGELLVDGDGGSVYKI